MDARKNIRLKQYDYKSDGYYFVTAVSKLRADLFLGKEAQLEKELRDLQAKTPGIELDYFVTMPNHVHIIFILHNCKLHLGEVVRRFKAKVSHTFGQNIWQANYYEHVIRNETALTKIREYISNNPQELLLKFDQFYK
ncbi:MAG: transposase [Candidatus Doudnabacteria bacterium]|nr:transposase [Candidatus Doudnabacteria bacterium]